MTTFELMGLLALGILWLNGGLVIAVAFKQLGNVRRLARWFREREEHGELVAGAVVGEARFAVRTIHQTGRAITTDGPDRILFTDGPQSFEVLGGAVKVAGRAIEVPPVDDGRAEVWVDGARTAEGVGCPGADHFDAAYEGASKFKGHSREVALEVRGGDRVWIAGRRDGERLEPWEDRPLIVSMIDPSEWAAGRTRLLLGFIAGATAGLVAVSALALTPPAFGTVSTIGGALGLAYFLGIQPLGTAVRDRVKTPARQLVGALWQRDD